MIDGARAGHATHCRAASALLSTFVNRTESVACFGSFWPILLQKSAGSVGLAAGIFFQNATCPTLPLSQQGSATFRTDATNAYAMHIAVRSGGCTVSFATRRRFCAIAAKVNSN
jgi:hypothetical protein